jgi:hypothetical protein
LIVEDLKVKLKAFWKRVRRYIERQLDILIEDIAPEVPDAPAEAAPPEEEEPPPAPAPEEPAPAPAPALEWRYGGFDGSRAAEDPECRIADLRMGRAGLSFRWEKGGCERFGAHGRDDYGAALACAFYWDEGAGKWIGGKFDWISTSRSSRSFENVREGYNGWDAAAFFAAPRRAFCVCAANGRARSNLLETT